MYKDEQPVMQYLPYYQLYYMNYDSIHGILYLKARDLP